MTDPIKEILDVWGLKLVNDAQDEVSRVVKYSGGQKPDLINKIKYRVLNTNNGYTFQFTMNDFGKVYPYYKDIEFGRRPGVKGVPTSALLKGFYANHNISPSKVIKEMRLKANPKSKAKANFEKDSKALAFIIQRSIKKKGIEARPFMDNIVNEERIKDLKTMLIPALKKKYVLEIKNALQK